jgi:integrase
VGKLVSLESRREAAQQPVAARPRRAPRQFGKLRRLPSKMWQASYLGPDGQRHNAPTTFQTKGDAETWLAMQQARIVEHRWKPAPPRTSARTLADYAEAWLADRELKPRTRAEYRRMLDSKIIPTLGHLELAAVTPAAVRAWHQSLDPAHKTARAHAYALLRTVLGAAVDDEDVPLEVNPCRIAGAGATKRIKAIRPATLGQLETITTTMPAKYRLMVPLASWCALRYGELAELRRGDLELAEDACVIRVRRAVTWPDGQPVIGEPKSDAGIRDVHVPPHLVGLIQAHLDDHAQPGETGLLFPNANGDHLHHGSLYKVYKRARAAAGRPDLRWHDLRHSGATWAAQSGATLAELMARLGHSTVAAALIYQHAAAGRDAEIARRLSSLVTNG